MATNKIMQLVLYVKQHANPNEAFWSTYIQSMYEYLSNVEITFAIMTPSIIQITHLHQQAGKQH